MLAFISCKNNDDSKNKVPDIPAYVNPLINKQVDSRIVLTVGKGNFTAFEVQKNFNIFRSMFLRQQNRQPNKAEIKTWKNQFVERAYLLADAWDKGYYDHKDVHTVVDNMELYMLTKSDSPLYKNIRDKVKTSQAAKEIAVDNYNDSIIRRASIIINRSALALFDPMLIRDKKVKIISKADVTGNLNKELAAYNATDGKRTNITINEFTDYYNSLVLRKILKDTADLRFYLKQMALNGYIRKDAEKLGVQNEPEFKLNKKNFTDNVVYEKYRQDRLGNSPVSETELKQAYNTIKDRATRPTGIVYSILTFENLPNAVKAMRLLQKTPTDTSLQLNKLSSKWQVKLIEGRKQIADTLKNILFRMKPGQVSFPIEVNNQFVILKLESATGNKPLLINDMRPYLQSIAMEKRKNDNQQNHMSELEKKYKKTDLIDINTLMGITNDNISMK